MQNFNQYCLNDNLFIDMDNTPIPNLSKYIKQLDKCFKKDSDNFAEICFVVFRIKKLFEHYYLVHPYNRLEENYTFDTIMRGFGISQSESSKILSCYDKFCCLSCSDWDTAKCCIIEEFKGFSKSKLFELLQVDNKQIIEDLQNKVIRYDFTIKQLRDYVKNIQALAKQNKLDKQENKEEINEEDIPPAYNPEQHYDFDYFETKNKAQLLNIVWELQKEYEKLKNNYYKLKKEKNKNDKEVK